MSRIIYLFGPVDSDMSMKFAKQVDTFIAESPTALITVRLNTSGGQAHDAMAIVDIMRTAGPKFHVICTGYAFSAGSIILMAGHKRSISQRSWIMVHEDQSGCEGDMRAVKAEAKFKMDEERVWGALMASRSAQDARYWANAARDTTYYSAYDALALGIVDEILKEPLHEITDSIRSLLTKRRRR